HKDTSERPPDWLPPPRQALELFSRCRRTGWGGSTRRARAIQREPHPPSRTGRAWSLRRHPLTPTVETVAARGGSTLRFRERLPSTGARFVWPWRSPDPDRAPADGGRLPAACARGGSSRDG